MENEKYLESLIEGLTKIVDKHEVEIGDVKKEVNLLNISNAEIKVKLTNIELSQEQIKNMINQSSRETEKSSHDNQVVITELIKAIKEDRQSDYNIVMQEKQDTTKIKMFDRKELWGILGGAIMALVTWLSTK